MPGRGSCRACAAWFIQLHLRGLNVPGLSPNPHETVVSAGGGVEPSAWGKPQPGLRRNLVDARKEQPRRSQAECARGLMLTTSLHLVGCSTGSSAGLAPFTIPL